MSSHPPKYVSAVGDKNDDEAAVGLLHAEEWHGRATLSPMTTAASRSGSRSVVYHLRPNWPVSDEIPHQQSVSVLGRSREETLRLVLEAFPDLETIDPDRLDFYIPSDPSGLAKEDISDYARISNPAWPDLSTSVVRVSILDVPGDNERRERRDRQRRMKPFYHLVYLTLGFGSIMIFALCMALRADRFEREIRAAAATTGTSMG